MADAGLLRTWLSTIPCPARGRGAEGHKQLIAAFRAAFPDLRVAVADPLEEGDRWRS